MTNTNKLNAIIEREGRSKKWIAEKLGISYGALWNKINNKREFTFEEIVILCDILHIDTLEEREVIFFNIDVDKMSTQEA